MAVAKPDGRGGPAGAGAREDPVGQRLEPFDRGPAHADQLCDRDRLHLRIADVGVDRPLLGQLERVLLGLGQPGGCQGHFDGVTDAVEDRGGGEPDPAAQDDADSDPAAGAAVDPGQPVVLVVD